MPKISPFLIENAGGYGHWCPACAALHFFTVRKPGDAERPAWSFNGDRNKPTFAPSMRRKSSRPTEKTERVCHYFLTNGVLDYCADSTHKLAGQKCDLPPLPASISDTYT